MCDRLEHILGTEFCCVGIASGSVGSRIESTCTYMYCGLNPAGQKKTASCILHTVCVQFMYILYIAALVVCICRLGYCEYWSML